MARMRPGGTERQMVGMLLAAHKVHWEPTLCVLYPGFELTRQVASHGVSVIEMPFTTSYDPRRMAWLRGLTRSGRFDVVHASLWGAGVFTRVAALRRGRPAVVVSERSVEDFRSRPGRLIDRTLRPVTDHYIGNSRDVVDFIQRSHRVPSDRVSLIGNGIDRKVFCRDQRQRPATQRRRVGCVGRLIRDKAFDTMIRALPAVLTAADVELVIAGEGPERARLEEAAVGLPVRFQGFLPTPRAVASFLRGLDLFVLPSRYEGLPNAVLEALACGVPVVATDVPGMREAVRDHGTLVPPDDPQRLAEAVVAALSTSQLPPSDLPIASFDDIATQHLQAFELAVARRIARRG
jgi:glycosyltransferase involved in cell wall biosynthesis